MLRTTDNASQCPLPSFQLSQPPLLIVAHSSARLWKLITHQRALLIRLRAVIIGSWISYYGTKRQQNSLPRKIGHPYCPPWLGSLLSQKHLSSATWQRLELSVSLPNTMVLGLTHAPGLNLFNNWEKFYVNLLKNITCHE